MGSHPRLWRPFGRVGFACEQPLTSSLRLACFATAALSLAACFNSNQPHGVAGGVSGRLLLTEVAWGRLVDVVDLDNVLIQTDVLVRPDLSIDGINYEMNVNPVTEVETLKVMAVSTTTNFALLLSLAESGLTTITAKGASDPPPYDMIPRNATVRLKFSDQVDPDSVDQSSIQVLSGDPSTNPFSVRFMIQNDVASGTGVVLLDPTISARDSATLGLPTNPVGFPESFDATADNLRIRIPTKADLLFGQPSVLTNLKGSRTFEASVTDPFEIAADGSSVVIRVWRTGNDQDLNRGFLEDLLRPGLIGDLDITLEEVQATNSSLGDLLFIYSIDAAHCVNLIPKVGDVLEVNNTIAVVTVVQVTTPSFEVVVRLLEGTIGIGSGLNLGGSLATRYTQVDAGLQLCYVDVDPTPTFSSTQITDLDPSSTFSVRFSEAMDPRTVLSLHSLALTSFEFDEPTNTGTPEVLYFRHEDRPEFLGESVADYIDRQRGYSLDVGNNGTLASSEFGGRFLFGPVQPDADSRSFTLSPVLGLADSNMDSYLQFSLALRDGLDGILDLSGNPLDFTGFVAGTPLPGIGIGLQMTSTTAGDAKYLALRALGVDENGDGLAEYRGQFGYSTGRLTGREAKLFSVDADSSNQFIGSQQAIPSPAIPAATAPYAPLSPTGAVVMTSYRPHDMGFGYGSLQEFNLDVVGMSWAPLGGLVQDDSMTRFSLALAHAKYMPDEVLNISGLPAFPNSGLLLSGDFDNNILGFDIKDSQGQPLYDETIVYDGPYVLRAINVFNAPSGVNMLGFPAFSTSYTWRDTAIPPDVTGTAPEPLSVGSPPSLYGPAMYGPEEAPSTALPLLVRFRNFPIGGVLGTNTFQVTQMVATSQLPAFRIFSSGGLDAAGNWNLVIPDNSNAGGTQPVGGYNSNGAKTGAFDPFVYWAEIDFSTTVSRVFTHWFDLGGSLPAGGAAGILIEPALSYQEAGASVLVEIRGAVQVDHSPTPDQNPSPLTTAAFDFDDFGEYVPGSGGVSTPSDWTTDFTSLEASQYSFVQLRITLLSNASAGLEAEMDGLGLAWDL